VRAEGEFGDDSGEADGCAKRADATELHETAQAHI
jgi:hypothetical protein